MSYSEKIIPEHIIKRKRFLFFFFGDVVLISLSVWLAFLLRFEGSIPEKYFSNGTITFFIFLVLGVTLAAFYLSRLYSFTWAYVSATEMVSLFRAAVLSFLVVSIVLLVLREEEVFLGFPRSTLFVSYFLIFIFTGAVRFAKRVYLELFLKKTKGAENTLIVGA